MNMYSRNNLTTEEHIDMYTHSFLNPRANIMQVFSMIFRMILFTQIINLCPTNCNEKQTANN